MYDYNDDDGTINNSKSYNVDGQQSTNNIIGYFTPQSSLNKGILLLWPTSSEWIERMAGEAGWSKRGHQDANSIVGGGLVVKMSTIVVVRNTSY